MATMYQWWEVWTITAPLYWLRKPVRRCTVLTDFPSTSQAQKRCANPYAQQCALASQLNFTNKQAARVTQQRLSTSVGAGGLLAVLPDPVTLDADAKFEQTQDFELHPTASLVAVDALTAGRVHTVRDQWSKDVLSGERW